MAKNNVEFIINTIDDLSTKLAVAFNDLNNFYRVSPEQGKRLQAIIDNLEPEMYYVTRDNSPQFPIGK